MFLATVVQDLPEELAEQVRARFGATLTPGESGETVRLELTPEQRGLLADPEIFFLDPDLNDEVERERRDRDGNCTFSETVSLTTGPAYPHYGSKASGGKPERATNALAPHENNVAGTIAPSPHQEKKPTRTAPARYMFPASK